jgi:hypothetical protein
LPGTSWRRGSCRSLSDPNRRRCCEGLLQVQLSDNVGLLAAPNLLRVRVATHVELPGAIRTHREPGISTFFSGKTMFLLVRQPSRVYDRS